MSRSKFGRDILFTSVTIRKEGKEVMISNQEKETPFTSVS